MTCIACHAKVTPRQRETRARVVKSAGFPVLIVVALIALPTQAAFVLVVFLVAADARGGRAA